MKKFRELKVGDIVYNWNKELHRINIFKIIEIGTRFGHLSFTILDKFGLRKDELCILLSKDSVNLYHFDNINDYVTPNLELFEKYVNENI